MRAHPPTVAEAMLTSPALSGPSDTVGDVVALLGSGHRHVALVVENGVLCAVLTRTDLAGVPTDRPARDLGRLEGRVVAPGADLETTRTSMLAEGRRRLAVIDDAGHLLGLLCLKQHGGGFCTAETVAERGTDRDRARPAPRSAIGRSGDPLAR